MKLDRMIDGYRKVLAPEHPRADRDGFVMEHILVAEKALGSFLPPGAVIHHVNEIKDDNRPENLVICEGRRYHKWIHIRMKIIDRGGNPDTEKICSRCQTVKPFAAFNNSRTNYDGLTHNCKDCYRFYGTRRFLRLKKIASEYRNNECRCIGHEQGFKDYQRMCGKGYQRRGVSESAVSL